MKKLLLVILFLFLSYISYAPELSVNLKKEQQNIIKRELLIQSFPKLSDLKLESVIDMNNFPILSPLDTSDLKKINSYFGYRKHPVLLSYKYHNGIDIDCSTGTKIFSTANGFVEEVKISKFGYGNYVLINHKNGYKTKYAHLKEINVSVGDFVKANDLIGISGKSGLVTGPHLHYEIIKDDKHIYPIKIITNESKEYITTLKKLQEYKSTLV